MDIDGDAAGGRDFAGLVAAVAVHEDNLVKERPFVHQWALESVDDLSNRLLLIERRQDERDRHVAVTLGLEEPVDIRKLVPGKRVLEDPGLDDVRRGRQLLDLDAARVDEDGGRAELSLRDLRQQVPGHRVFPGVLWQSKDKQTVLKRTVFDGGFHVILGLFDGETGLRQFSLHLAVRFKDAVVDGRRLAWMRDMDKACSVHDPGLCQPAHHRPGKGGIGVTAGEDGCRRSGRGLTQFVGDHLGARTAGGFEQARVFVTQEVEVDHERPRKDPRTLPYGLPRRCP